MKITRAIYRSLRRWIRRGERAATTANVKPGARVRVHDGSRDPPVYHVVEANDSIIGRAVTAEGLGEPVDLTDARNRMTVRA